MENKQQTAVDWLWEKLLEETETGELRYHLKYDVVKVFNEALKMEREQIINAFGVGCQIESNRVIGYHKMANQYYEETYGTDKD